MCGIVGFALPGTETERAEEGLRTMCRAMTHRGPDDRGTFVEPAGREGRTSPHTLGLGMQRLSIIDTAGGKQPIFNEDKSVVVVFNGEIYNHLSIRQRLLSRGHTLQSETDTEVLVHLYEEKGAELVNDLTGMYSFALYDRRREKLLLVRDRLGIKPLYLLDHNGGLLFSSEIKSITAVPELWPEGWTPEVDNLSLEAMLMLMYVPSPRTIYQGLTQLPPGHCCEIDLRTGKKNIHQYWDLATSKAEKHASYDDAYENLKDLLEQCVKDHLISDVPVGAFVSGGVDSSLVASYARQHYADDLQTFSIGFSESNYDETQDALFVVKQLQTAHTLQYATYDNIYGTLPTIFRAMDQPFGDSSMLPTYLVSQLAASRLKVVLSGDGGDEVFAGYTKHLIEHVKSKAGALPPELLHGVHKLLRNMPKSRAGKITDLFRRAEKAARGVTGDPAESYLEMMKLTEISYVSDLMQSPVGFDAVTSQVLKTWRKPQGATGLQRTQYADSILPLADDMLTKVDRMSMLCSLEVRVPLLDHRIVEFGYHLPDAYKLQGTVGKRILKQLFCERFGLEKYSKPKKGFGVPIETWFNTRLKPLIDHLFAPKRLEAQGLMRPDKIGGENAYQVARTAPFVFWNALMVQVWHDLQVSKKDDLFNYL